MNLVKQCVPVALRRKAPAEPVGLIRLYPPNRIRGLYASRLVNLSLIIAKLSPEPLNLSH